MDQNGVYQQIEENIPVTTELVAKHENLSQDHQEVPVEDDQDEDYVPEAEEDEEEEESVQTTMKPSKDSVMSEFDTADAFNQVFGDRREFDSWDAFTDYLEEFQTLSGTRYKPRSACRVDHVNERRMGSPIPERFVYAAIKMICIHYGDGGSGKRRNYVGKGCQAYMRVSYSRGAMRITQTHLVHNNHEPTFDVDHPHTRNFRVFNFNEELDELIVREVLKANPFEFKNGEKEWTQAVEKLKKIDDKFATITSRLVKKRIRFLLDNFAAIHQGKKPPADDEMGAMLYKLDNAKKHLKDSMMSTPSVTVKTKKRRGRGRPRKVSASDLEFEAMMEEDDEDDLVAYSAPKKKARQSTTSVTSPPTASSSKPTSNTDLSQLLSYLRKKDEEERRMRQTTLEEDRKLRQEEVLEERKWRRRDAEEDRRLRQREIDLRKEELAYQKERFEFEKTERKAHMDLLKSQLQVFEQSMLMNKQQQQQIMPITISQPIQTQQTLQPQPTQQQQQTQQQQGQATEYTQFHYR